MAADLRQKLETLHGELARTREVDPQLRELLVTLLTDITQLLEQPGTRADADAPLADRLETVAVKFEAEHPALGTAIRQVVDTLGKAGI